MHKTPAKNNLQCATKKEVNLTKKQKYQKVQQVEDLQCFCRVKVAKSVGVRSLVKPLELELRKNPCGKSVGISGTTTERRKTSEVKEERR